VAVFRSDGHGLHRGIREEARHKEVLAERRVAARMATVSLLGRATAPFQRNVEYGMPGRKKNISASIAAEAAATKTHPSFSPVGFAWYSSLTCGIFFFAKSINLLVWMKIGSTPLPPDRLLKFLLSPGLYNLTEQPCCQTLSHPGANTETTS
jgi:hypothetical protein